MRVDWVKPTPPTIKTAYIAGPMAGRTDFNYPAFKAAEQYLVNLGWTVHSPAQWPQDWALTDYYRADLELLLKCDSLVLLPGWPSSTGANLEYTIARHLKLAIYYLSPDARGLVRMEVG